MTVREYDIITMQPAHIGGGSATTPVLVEGARDISEQPNFDKKWAARGDGGSVI
jgi:hypothetical protein